MKLLPVDLVEVGMCLAESIYDKNERVLLKKGTIFTKPVINILKKWNISDIYINDAESEDPEECMHNEFTDRASREIIMSDIKSIAINTLMNFLHNSSPNNGSTQESPSYGSSKMKKYKLYRPIVNILEDISESVLSKENILNYLMLVRNIDDYTFSHSIKVSAIALLLGINLELEETELYSLYIGAILHDIGKILVPAKLIKKNSKLTEFEFDIVKQHTVRGYEYLSLDPDIPEASKAIVLQHHERFDGHGYPHGLEGSQINKLARIVSIADIYDALISDRPYRKAVSFNEAMEYILACGNTYLDYEMILSFSKLIIPYTRGMTVQLSNGFICTVEETYQSYPLRPLVKLKNANKLIDLRNELNIVVKDVLG